MDPAGTTDQRHEPLAKEGWSSGRGEENGMKHRDSGAFI